MRPDLVSQKKVAMLEFMNTSPIFKGLGTIFVGLIGLLFAYYMIKRWNEPRSASFKVFIGFSIFVVLYGSYVLIFQPAQWIPPWWD